MSDALLLCRWGGGGGGGDAGVASAVEEDYLDDCISFLEEKVNILDRFFEVVYGFSFSKVGFNVHIKIFEKT